MHPEIWNKFKKHFQGDSGSGLICIHNGLLTTVGITTYGLDCGINGMPGVYTALAYYANFIKDVVWDYQ